MNTDTDEVLPHHRVYLMLYKTSPRHRFVSLYRESVPLGHTGSKSHPLMVKIKSGPAFDMLFLLCSAHFRERVDGKIKSYGWVSLRYLCEVYFNDSEEIRAEILHGYIGTKLRGTLRKAFSIVGLDAHDVLEREDNHYRIAVPKENLMLDVSLREFGLCCETKDREFGSHRDDAFRAVWEEVNGVKGL